MKKSFHEWVGAWGGWTSSMNVSPQNLLGLQLTSK
jgi:hypothetical protein